MSGAGPVEEALVTATRGDADTGLDRLRDDAVDLVALSPVDERSDGDVLADRVADRERVGVLSEQGGVVVGDRGVDEVAAAGHADLTGVGDGSPGAHRGSLVQVDVVHDDECGVPAELQVDPLEVLSRGDADGASCPGGAGERDDGDLRMLYDGCADVSAAGEHVQQTGRQARFFEDAGEDDAAADRGAAWLNLAQHVDSSTGMRFS